MSISQIKSNARQALSGKWGKGAITILTYIGFIFIIGLIQRAFEEKLSIQILLGIATIIIQVPITLGLTYAFIKLKRDEEVRVFDFLNMGFSNFKRAWKIRLRTALKMIIPIIISSISSIVLAGILLMIVGMVITAGLHLLYGAIDLFEVFEMFGFNFNNFIIALIIHIISMIFLIKSSLLYSLTSYIAYDNPNMTALEVVNESKRIMKGKRCKLFLLQLSFIGWAILTGLTFGIGALLLLPYMQVSSVCFYEQLLEKNDTNDSESNTDAIKEY